jgi:hypothetical protein
MWEGFSTFCREELGLEPVKPVTVFFEPLLSAVEDLLYMTEDVEADQTKIVSYRQLITSCWQRYSSADLRYAGCRGRHA